MLTLALETPSTCLKDYRQLSSGGLAVIIEAGFCVSLYLRNLLTAVAD